ncbi:TraB/GumN family protein [Methanotorris igneus]|uniref:TraB family protein n=1 Tax=Methanotorris igneus (strain DSM 5666 / JCM 11834 / Kol 5) TaxID=880724 RepID=F6BAH0_METIK|nr:TraB/GumN family protein [Methanotorris igneus]AEF96983.1 TraB family protein [Methanotorris igneus Kol 5]
MKHIKINNGFNECNIYLIGTAHVSEESVRKVEEAIININPDVVAVELDRERFLAIMGNNDNMDNIDIKRVIKEGRVGIFLLHMILSYFQKKIGEELGVKPGSEMKKAIEIAIQHQKPISLIDRQINITLTRLLNKMSLKEKINFFLSLFEENGEIDIDNKSINDMVNNADELVLLLKDISPTIYEVLVDERDRYMAKNLYELSKGNEKIVAVVGAGHIRGIINYLKKLEKGEDIDLNELNMTKKSRIWKYIGKIISVAIVLVILYGFYSISSNIDALKKLTLEWVIINGFLSALGVVIARGHVISALVAFLSAPITSLIPFVGAGWIAGLAELKFREIKKSDIIALFHANSVKELLNNNLMRILLVAALANLGSAIGTLYFIPKFLGH